MNRLSTIAAILLLAGVSASSCKKTETPFLATTDTGKVFLEFFNVVGGSNLNLNNQWYRNESGDSFRVSRFNYYISNIRLSGDNGAVYREPESYHLVEQSATPGQPTFHVNSVPAGRYNSITFLIGVDSARNVSGAQSGDLDPVLGNFWSWNTGYIMLKFEGVSPQAPTTNGRVVIHTGGFSGANNVLKEVTLPFENPIEVTRNQVPHIHLQADVQRLFGAPNPIGFSQVHTIHMPGAAAKRIAEKYADMFSVTYAGY